MDFRCWADASGFDPDVRSDIDATVFKGAALGSGFSVQRFDNVLDHETAATQPAEDFLPPMQVFQSTFFAMGTSDDGRERPFTVVGLDDLVALLSRSNVRLQAGGGCSGCFFLVIAFTAIS